MCVKRIWEQSISRSDMDVCKEKEKEKGQNS
jgi:hypothetical protein